MPASNPRSSPGSTGIEPFFPYSVSIADRFPQRPCPGLFVGPEVGEWGGEEEEDAREPLFAICSEHGAFCRPHAPPTFGLKGFPPNWNK